MIVLLPFVMLVNALLGFLSIYVLSILLGAEDCSEMLFLPYAQGNDCTAFFAVMLACGCMILSAVGSIWFGVEHFFKNRETY